jgi:hypothetical protein
MMAAAEYADDPLGEPPPDLKLAIMCARWNCLPYEGGLMDQPAGTINRMSVAKNIYDACKARMNYKDSEGQTNVVEWTNNNPEAADMLAAVDRMRIEEMTNG